MHKTGWAGCLCGLLAVVGAQASGSAVTVKRLDYHGWKGAYRLTNKTVELVFVPQIGRILHYGYVGGANILWENPKLQGKTTDFSKPVTDWQNYGGDKVWPSPQSKWNWPPDPSFESAPQTVRVLSGNRLQVTSPASKQCGVRFVREIEMDATGTGVTLKNTMMNVDGKPVEWGVWEVAQIESPDVARIPLNKGGKFPADYYTFADTPPHAEMLLATGGELQFRRHSTQNGKVGVDLPGGHLSAEKDGVRIEVWATPVQSSGDYPDDGCALEIWSNPDPEKYMELELLGPVVTLPPGKSVLFTTHWSLAKRS